MKEWGKKQNQPINGKKHINAFSTMIPFAAVVGSFNFSQRDVSVILSHQNKLIKDKMEWENQYN